MKRVMLVGESGVGKRSLMYALSGQDFVCVPPMSVAFCGPFIYTPGEFLENRRFYQALITASMDCDVLAMFQDATRSVCLFPPQFAVMFNKRVVGVISKSDSERADFDRAGRFLLGVGVHDILRLSIKTGEGLDEMKALLG